MFGLKSKSKLALRVDTAEEPTRPKTSTAKSYLMGVATTSQKFIKKQTPSPETEPLTPEDKIISLPIAPSQTVPSLIPDKGISTPPSSEKRRIGRSSVSNSSYQFATPPDDELSPPIVPSVSSNESDTECVFCSVGISFTEETDPVYRLKCGHHAHDRCLYRLNGSVKEIGDYDVLCSMCERPAAHSTVDKPKKNDTVFTSASNFAPGFRPGFSRPISNQLANRSMPRSSSFGIMSSSDSSLRLSLRQSQSYGGHNLGSISGLRYPSRQATQPNGLRSPMLAAEEPGSPISSLALLNRSESDSTSVSTGRATLLSGLSRTDAQESTRSKSSSSESAQTVSAHEVRSPDLSESDFALLAKPWSDNSARHEMNSLLAGENAMSVKCSPRMHPFRILTTTDQPDNGKTRVHVTVQAEPSALEKDPLTEYRFSAKDIKHSINVRQQLAKMKFEYKDIALADMTTLRLHTLTSVTSPDSRTLDWKDCEAHLFDDLIIITRFFKVSAAMSLKHSRAHAHVEPSRPNVVELHFDNPDIVDLNLNMASPTLAYMWKHAFEDPKGHFPVAPGPSFDHYVARLEEHLQKTDIPTFSPVEVILCLPVNSSSQVLAMQQALRAAVSSLTYRDKLALIVFSKQGILRKVNFTVPHSSIWEGALDGLGERLGELKSSVCTLDAVINAAHQLLAHHKALDATASIILVNDSEIRLEASPTHLKWARVPVQTIGLSAHHNAMSLSMLAQYSEGTYHYVRSNDELDDLISAIIRLESRYTHKNVILRFKPRISTSIVGIFGGNIAPSFESPYSDFLPFEPRAQMLDGGSSVLEWRLGTMRMGDIRSLVVEIEGDVPSGSNILHVNLEATHVLSPDDTACSSSFRIPVSVASEPVNDRMKSLLVVSSITQAVLVELELAAASLFQDESRAAYDQLLLGLQRLQSVYNSGLVSSKPMLALLEAYQTVFDVCCDEIVKHNQRTQSFMHYLLQKLWIFYTQRSMFERDQIEGMYYEQTSSLD